MSITDWTPAVRAEIMEILAAVEEEAGIVGVHCEDHQIIQGVTARLKRGREDSPALHPKSRPAEAEAEAIHRLLTLAKIAETPVNIVHLSCALGLRELRRVREDGQQVFAETCPQYLILDDSVYDQPGFGGAAYVCAPPLRKKEDVRALWTAVVGDEIDMIGVEHRPALFYHFGVNVGRATVEQMCRLLSERPARVFGMYPKKGSLSPGSDADLVVWDPEAEWTIAAERQVQNVDYTPYEGIQVKGRAQKVFLRGRLAAEDGKVRAGTAGRYLSRGRRQL